MASRSPEATGNGWGHDGDGTDSPVPGTDRGDEIRVAADASPERRVEALEAELERRDRQLQLVVDHYESLLTDREDDEVDGTGGGLVGRVRALLGR